MWEARSDTNWVSKRSDPAKRSVGRSSRAQGAAQSSPNTRATRYFVGSSVHFFSKGEKSGRGFSWEQGLPPHTTTDCSWAHTPQNCFTFPSQNRTPGKQRTSAHTSCFSSSSSSLRRQQDHFLQHQCRVTPSTHCLNSLFFPKECCSSMIPTCTPDALQSH